MITSCTDKQGSKAKVAQSCLTHCDPVDCCPWKSPGQNTGVRSLSLLQGVVPTQGSSPGLPHCRQILYHQGSPRILEWVAYPFSSRFSWPRNQTGVSCIAGRFFTSWAIREAQVGKGTFKQYSLPQIDKDCEIWKYWILVKMRRNRNLQSLVELNWYNSYEAKFVYIE